MNMEIDDSHIDNMGLLFEKQGMDIDKSVNAYLSLIKDVSEAAVVSGDMSEALAKYSVYAGRMSGVIKELSELVRAKLNDYIREIDEADQYV